MYPGMKIVDIGPGTKDKFTVEKYKDELRRPYSEKDLYLSKAAHAEKKILYIWELAWRSH